MPRPKKEAAAEPKKRSRNGCWPCKARKVKCGEEKPVCVNCDKSGETCDYSIRLNWGGRSRKDKEGTPTGPGSLTFVSAAGSGAPARSAGLHHEHIFSSQHLTPAEAHLATAHPPRSPGRSRGDLSTPEPTAETGGAVGVSPNLHLRSEQHLANSDSRLSPHVLPPNPYLASASTYDGSAHQSPAWTGRTFPTSAPVGDDFSWSSQQRAKRVRLNSPSLGQPSSLSALSQYPGLSPDSGSFTAHSITSIANTPATPGSSVNAGSPYPLQHSSLGVQDPLDLRRLSVKSLLSDPEEIERPRHVRSEGQATRTYGYDHGLPDLDVPRNDDGNVVLPRSPDLRRASVAISEVSNSSGDVDARQIAFEPGGYYAQPVAIRLPRSLEPLPPELLENQMNLLYFHHFINHTGRIMVPHDCPENPFRRVLPQMAVRNTHLLHLLLTFSASHRAKLLDHPEPENRIAGWMSDVLPALRQALDERPGSPGNHDRADPSSLAPLATAIMLASLEIFMPNTFSVQIRWQQHLQVARQMIVAMGGLQHLARKADGARDKAIFFLSRWFAYLDVLGSLSNRHEQPLFGAYLEDGGGLWLVNRDHEEIYQIDCFFGFSGRCIALLAQVAELAAQCDNQRIDPVTNQVKGGWRPEDSFRQPAEELKKRLTASASTVFRGCMHTEPGTPPLHEAKDGKDAEEIYATNEAYHWAGMIHLSRRVLALPSSDPEVQDSVQKVLRSLQKVRRGSSAESCLLFPMFTAGCEAQREDQRKLFMDRLKAVEGWGMQHVGRARALMQTVWDTGRPWELLVDGEFFG